MTDFINPYTFLPISDNEPIRKSLKRGNLTGKITCTLTIEKPTFIPNTSGQFTFTSGGKTCKAEEFFSYDDLSNQTGSLPVQAPTEPRIPGSEIRGMIRNVYEQLTNSCLSVIDRKNLTHMRTTLPKKPALWDMKENKLYSCEKAMLYTWGDKNSANMDCGSMGTSYPKQWLRKQGYRTGQIVYFQLGMEYQKKVRGIKIPMPHVVTKIAKEHSEGWISGYLLIGEDFQNKHHDSIFYVQSETLGQSLTDIEEKDVERFEYLLNIYIKLAKQNNAYSDYIKNYYDIKKEVKAGGEGRLVPVYYAVVGGNYYLSPACITREVFSHTISDILRDGHKVHQPCDGENDKWCPACRLFGKIGQDGQGKALASRLRFCDSEVIEFRGEKAKFGSPVIMPILGTPHYSATEFYLKKPDGAAIWNYDYKVSYQNGEAHKEPNIPSLRGRKVYWRGECRPFNPQITSVNMQTCIRRLSINNSAKFTIYFEDLQENELALLVWCLGLDDEGSHQIGRGKPLGMGTCKIAIEGIFERTYSMNSDNEVNAGEEQLDKNDLLNNIPAEYKAFQDAILVYSKKLPPRLAKLVSYPVPNNETKIFKWFAYNKGPHSMSPEIQVTLPNFPVSDNIDSIKMAKNDNPRNK